MIHKIRGGQMGQCLMLLNKETAKHKGCRSSVNPNYRWCYNLNHCLRFKELEKLASLQTLHHSGFTFHIFVYLNEFTDLIFCLIGTSFFPHTFI